MYGKTLNFFTLKQYVQISFDYNKIINYDIKYRMGDSLFEE